MFYVIYPWRWLQ